MPTWPNQSTSSMNAFFGNNGGGATVNKSWERTNIVSIKPPYRMVTAWAPYAAIKEIRCHKKVADDLLAILTEIKDHYGSQDAIEKARMHFYGGCYVYRLKRGGSTLSIHSWGCAIDLDPVKNGFGVKYKPNSGMMPLEVVRIFEDHGWTWGGLWRTGDAMHFQAANISGQKRATTTVMNKPESPEPVTSAAPNSSDRRTRMARRIIGYEARRDGNGNIRVYSLPANDGGGSKEYAGINEKYHPQQLALLEELVRAGKYKEAEAAAVEYVVQYTNVVASYSTNAGVEFMLRDCCWNRGPIGAAKILQIALGVEVDGIVGSETRNALTEIGPTELLKKLHEARYTYEKDYIGIRGNLIEGLKNRWDKSLSDAKAFALETPTKTQGTAGGAAGGAVVAGGGAVVATGVNQGWGLHEWSLLILIVLVVIGIGYLGYRWWIKRKRSVTHTPTPTPLLDAAEESVAPGSTMRIQPLAEDDVISAANIQVASGGKIRTAKTKVKKKKKSKAKRKTSRKKK